MKASGNGTPKQCVENLLSLWRYEVPFDRARGIDTRIFDHPANTAEGELRENALWLIRTYETRVNADRVEITVNIAEDGDYYLTASISDREG